MHLREWLLPNKPQPPLLHAATNSVNKASSPSKLSTSNRLSNSRSRKHQRSVHHSIHHSIHGKSRPSRSSRGRSSGLSRMLPQQLRSRKHRLSHPRNHLGRRIRQSSRPRLSSKPRSRTMLSHRIFSSMQRRSNRNPSGHRSLRRSRWLNKNLPKECRSSQLLHSSGRSSRKHTLVSRALRALLQK